MLEQDGDLADDLFETPAYQAQSWLRVDHLVMQARPARLKGLTDGGDRLFRFEGLCKLLGRLIDRGFSLGRPFDGSQQPRGQRTGRGPDLGGGVARRRRIVELD